MRLRIMRWFFVFGLSLACFASQVVLVNARTWEDSIAEVLPRVFRFDEEGNRIELLEESMGYRYFLPSGYDPSREYPLVLFLHGAGESGFDNVEQVRRNISNLIKQTDENYPAILLAPQLSTSSGWGPQFNDRDRTDEVLDRMLSEFPIDTDRLYVTGLSMGGFGTMSYLHQYHVYDPGKLEFAAAAPIAGAWLDLDAVDVLQETPVWLAHGESDTVVVPEYSRQTFNALAGYPIEAPITFDRAGALGPMAESGNVRYTEYPRTGHNSWSRFYQAPDVYEWMFSQSLAVPEPSSLAIGISCCLLGVLRRKR